MASRALGKPTFTRSRREPTGGPASADVVAAMDRLRERGGRPLPADVRTNFENRYGADLSVARVHTGPDAEELARRLDARAVTFGPDIVFGEAAYAPESAAGREVLAHELAHVVQDLRGAPRDFRRLTIDSDFREAQEGLVSRAAGRLEDGVIVFDTLPLPAFKVNAEHRAPLYQQRANAHLLKRTANYNRGSPRQTPKWRREVLGNANTSPIVQILKNKLRTAWALPEEELERSRARWVVEVPHGDPKHLEGRLTTLARRLTVPTWGGTTSTVPKNFEVDHIVELQLGDWHGQRASWANTLVNMELLESSINQSSGGTVRGEIARQARAHITASWAAMGDSSTPTESDAQDLLRTYHFDFRGVTPGQGGQQPSGPEDYWTREAIETGLHLGPVLASDTSYLSGSRSGPARVRILFDAADLSAAQTYAWNSSASGGAPVEATAERTLGSKLAGLHVTSKRFDTGPGFSGPLGTLRLEVSPNDPTFVGSGEAVELAIPRIPGARYAGHVDSNALTTAARTLGAKGMSPVSWSSMTWDPAVGLSGEGKVEAAYAQPGETSLVRSGRDGRPSIRLEPGRGRLEGELPADGLDPPGPIQVLSSDIRFSSTDSGAPRVEGEIVVQIRDLAEGSLHASLSEEGMVLGGELTAESRFFRRATIHGEYDSNEGVSGGAILQLDTSKLPGVTSGTVTIRVEQSRWSVTGSAEVQLLGLAGTLTVGWSEAEGTTLAGRIPIQEGQIPGLRGGFLEVGVVRRPDGELGFSATGEGRPAIPGLDAAVRLSWIDGVLTAELTTAYRHGFLGGSLTFGVTNQQIGEDGRPTGDAGEELRVYGGGSLDATFGLLRGTVGAQLLPNGEMQLTGGLGFARELELFSRRELRRRLFALDIDIPIAGITVMGRGFGIFAFIGGGVDASAGVGPGVLRDTQANITYNPSRPEDTVLGGSAELYLPADAGLRLFLRAGVGGSLVIASVRGGIEGGAELGVQAHVRARVDLRWTPSEGLHIDVLAEALARPNLTLDLSGFAEVDVALLGTVWEKRWTALSIQLGSGLEVGFRATMRIDDAEVRFDASSVEFIFPDLDFSQLIMQQLRAGGTERGA